MAKIVRVYRREAWQICVSLVFLLIFGINLGYIDITFNNKSIPSIWAIPTMLLVCAVIFSLGWFVISLNKKPYDMVIENITNKEQRITYKRAKNAS